MRLKLLLAFCTLSFAAEAQSSSGVDYDYIPDATYEEIADRISCIESDIPLEYNDKVKGFIDYFTVRNRPYTLEFLRKTDLYFPLFDAAFEKYGVPKELKYLAIVESGLRPNAISHANAVGLWQFMSGTGRMYGLHSNWYVDDRMDPYESSEAAARHLRDLYEMFDDWELALAAYNCGAGNVRKAIRRSGYKNKFWDIYRYLPRETRSYVPQFVAICYTVNYADAHNLFPENIISVPAYDTVHVSQYLHLETFASQLNTCIDDLLRLNPGIKRGALPEGTSGFALKVPSDLKEKIVTDRTAIYDSAGKVGKEQLDYLARNMPGSTYGRTKQVYKVRSGDVLGTIASRYYVSVADIKSWNNLSSNMIRVGQYLSIWVLPTYSSQTKDLYASASTTPKPTAVSSNIGAPATSGGSKVHYVRQGDTLWEIANGSGLSIEQLKQLNNLKSNTIQPGQKLILSKD